MAVFALNATRASTTGQVGPATPKSYFGASSNTMASSGRTAGASQVAMSLASSHAQSKASTVSLAEEIYGKPQSPEFLRRQERVRSVFNMLDRNFKG